MSSCPRIRVWLSALVAVCMAVSMATATARAADCPEGLSYNGACGPKFELPSWGDGAGWTNPSKYSTIQLADLTGNGVDELIARNDDGIEIWWFDTTVGQWRPAVGPKSQPQVLTDFRSPLPSEAGPNWTQPQYYSTIQTAQLDGPGHGADIIARFPTGLRVYHYTPPAGTKDINGGTWSLVSKDGPFSDADGYTDPALYLSIHVQAGNGNPADQPGEVTAQSKTGPVTYFWTGKDWILAGAQLRELGLKYASDPATYLNLKPATLSTPDGVVPAVATWSSGGVIAFYKKHVGADWHWQLVGKNPSPGPFNTINPCGDVSRCFSYSPSYYTTLRFANIDGKSGDELLGRTTQGLEAWQLSADATTWKQLATLTALKGTAQELDKVPGRWGSIGTGDVLGNGRDQVLALDGSTLAAWSYDSTSNSWSQLGGTALKLGGDAWNADPSHYSTIEVGDVTGDGHDAVIARGPNGIRTWFYCTAAMTTQPCTGQAGWTSWLPQDTISYPKFSSTQAIYWANSNGSTVGRANGDGTGVNQRFITSATRPVGVAVDGQHIYWSNALEGTIGRANLDGTGVNQDFITVTGLGQLDQVAVDGQHIYWSNALGGTIGRANLDGTGVDQGFITGGHPDSLAVDAQHIYWTNERDRAIGRANLDGSAVNQSFITDANRPVAVAVDAQHIYWSNALGGTIGRANLDGSAVSQSFIADVQPEGLAVDGQHIYWGNGGTSIGRANLDGTGVDQAFITGADDPADLAVVSSGQPAAFVKLNALAHANDLIPGSDDTVRDVWTETSAPTDSTMTDLANGILRFANCPVGAQPPFAAGACQVPSGSSRFTAAGWTAVVNEVLGEITLVKDTNDFFVSQATLLTNTYLVNDADLDAIARHLGLEAAADNEVNGRASEIMSGLLQIIGAIAGAFPGGEAVGVPLEATGELISMLSSGTPKLTDAFHAKYIDLKTTFDAVKEDADNGIEDQSQEVRDSYALMSLLAQLTTGGGPWSSPDTVGLESASDEGFVLWAFQKLLPTLYARYKITGCGESNCALTGPGPETIGAPPDFTTIGPPPTHGLFGEEASPCQPTLTGRGQVCDFTALPSAISTKVWGALEPDSGPPPKASGCIYDGQSADTKWDYKKCNLGVNSASSVSMADGPANGWDFSNYCGAPFDHACQNADGTATVGHGGRLTLTGAFDLPAGFTVTSATIAPDRLLYEPAGPDGGSVEVVDRSSGHALGAVRMTRHGGSRMLADAPNGHVRAHLELGPASDGQRPYDLTLTGVSVDVPNACQALSPADALATAPFELTSTLRLSDGDQTHAVSLPAVWHCERDRAGEVTQLRPAEHRALPQRPGLAVSIAGPRVLDPGATVTYTVRVRNTRHGSRKTLVTGLWGIAVHSAVTVDGAARRPRALGQVAELRRGRSRALALRVHVPGTADQRVCVTVGATALSARPATARRCARISHASPIGLG